MAGSGAASLRCGFLFVLGRVDAGGGNPLVTSCCALVRSALGSMHICIGCVIGSTWCCSLNEALVVLLLGMGKKDVMEVADQGAVHGWNFPYAITCVPATFARLPSYLRTITSP